VVSKHKDWYPGYLDCSRMQTASDVRDTKPRLCQDGGEAVLRTLVRQIARREKERVHAWANDGHEDCYSLQYGGTVLYDAQSVTTALLSW
jgi:hypothetical protein